MRIAKEIRGEQVAAFVFTGDGRTEVRHVSALCEKLNGTTKILWFPVVPLMGRKDTGLNGLRILRDVVILKGVSKLLFVVDREHFREEARRRGRELDAAKDFLEKQVRARIEAVYELRSRYAFLLRASLGGESFDLCLAIRGRLLHADEERAHLIQLKLNTQVEPDDRKIRAFLQKNRIDEQRLIKECAVRYLEQAFPGLYYALKWVEEQ